MHKNTRLRAGTFGLVLALVAATGSTFSPVLLAAQSRPQLMLPNSYHAGVALSDYWVSEKYDGVRGYWDGEKLLTRAGHAINAPAWFTAGWPKTPLDGELWAGRGLFSTAERCCLAGHAFHGVRSACRHWRIR